MMRLIMMAAIMLAGFVSCNSAHQQEVINSPATDTSALNADKSEIQVLYFHGERRCPTCIAVGDITERTIGEKYAGKTTVVFRDINIENPENEELARKYEVAGSSLIIDAFGNIENITGYAFQNAKSRPDSLQLYIERCINKYLK